MELKICCRCKEEQSIENFSWKNKVKNTRSIECKKCHRLVRNSYYDRNIEKEIKRTKDRKKEIKNFIIEYKKNCKCLHCEENEPVCLDFHHKDPKQKEFQISKAVDNGWCKEKILKEIEKCDCVCSNCHRKIHAGISQW